MDKVFVRLASNPINKMLLLILGLPLHIIVFIIFLIKKPALYELPEAANFNSLITQLKDQIRKENDYFHIHQHPKKIEKEATKRAKKQVKQNEASTTIDYMSYFALLLKSKKWIRQTFIPGLLMYGYLWLYKKPLRSYIYKRIISSIIVFFGVILFVFTLLFFAPKDTAENVLGKQATAEQKEAFNEQYHLNDSYSSRLKDNVKGLLTFNLGTSFEGEEQISTSIAQRFPITLKLTALAIILVVIIGIPVGVLAALRQQTLWDYGVMFAAIVGISMPGFWQGLILSMEFSIKQNIVPARYSPSDYLSIILPLIVLSTVSIATVARVTRATIVKIMDEQYIVSAQALGLAQQKIFFKYITRNALLPIVSIVLLQSGIMLGGTAVAEKLFKIDGIGNYMITKHLIPDVPAIMGGVVYIAFIVILINLLVDILFAWLNPHMHSDSKEVSR
ncbi:ABC transporter permease [Kurthia sibirica]|nr:ABC transporter permease [Kurthia sibirica]GEK33508.1 membrane protein [Kurthia sibirica]